MWRTRLGANVFESMESLCKLGRPKRKPPGRRLLVRASGSRLSRKHKLSPKVRLARSSEARLAKANWHCSCPRLRWPQSLRTTIWPPVIYGSLLAGLSPRKSPPPRATRLQLAYTWGIYMDLVRACVCFV